MRIRDDYDKINSFVGLASNALRNRRDAVRTIGTAMDYFNDASTALGSISPPAPGTREHNRYVAAERAIQNLRKEIREYAREEASRRVNDVYGKIGDIHLDISRTADEPTNIHFRATKNPLKIIRVGRPNRGAVGTAVEETKSYITQSETYIGGIASKLKATGLDEPDDKTHFGRMKAKLKTARDNLERESNRHETVSSS